MENKMDYMKQATYQGCKARTLEEVPIGAIIVKDDKIIARAFNTREKDQIATHHAEIKAIEKANKKLHSWRLDDCDMYVTLEPCPMCAGAIINARIRTVYYAVKDESSGGISRFDILDSTLNHTTKAVQLTNYEAENVKLIKDFFKSKRKK